MTLLSPSIIMIASTHRIWHCWSTATSIASHIAFFSTQTISGFTYTWLDSHWSSGHTLLLTRHYLFLRHSIFTRFIKFVVWVVLLVGFVSWWIAGFARLVVGSGTVICVTLWTVGATRLIAG